MAADLRAPIYTQPAPVAAGNAIGAFHVATEMDAADHAGSRVAYVKAGAL